MTQSKTSDAGRVLFADVAEFVSEASRRRGQIEQEAQSSPPPFYRLALGREPIDLGDVEFRILLLLASKPYRPFSRHRIAAAVSTPQQAVTAETIDGHIAALRLQLGFFRDYVQTVPYLGYRFKA